jgi:hypothetical protein
MTPNEFVIWLKGFTQAANNFTCTPKQWDDIREQLSKVELYEKLNRYTLDVSDSNWNTTTTGTITDTTYKQDELTTDTIF